MTRRKRVTAPLEELSEFAEVTEVVGVAEDTEAPLEVELSGEPIEAKEESAVEPLVEVTESAPVVAESEPEVTTEPDALGEPEVPAEHNEPEVPTITENIAPKVVKSIPKAPEPVETKKAIAAKPKNRRLRNQLKFVR